MATKKKLTTGSGTVGYNTSITQGPNTNPLFNTNPYQAPVSGIRTTPIPSGSIKNPVVGGGAGPSTIPTYAPTPTQSTTYPGPVIQPTSAVIPGSTASTLNRGTPTQVSNPIVTTAPVVKAPDDASYKFRADTGELNTNYTDYVAPGSAAYAYKQSDSDIASEQQYEDINDYYQSEFNQVIDPEKTYKDTLRRYQSQIDMINNLFNDQLNQSRITNDPNYKAREAQNRIGQVFGGIAQSPMGQAQTNQIQEANAQEQASAEAIINDQRATALANVFGEVRKSSEAELTAKREAKRKGADALLENINAAPERKKKRISTAMKSLIAQGIDINELTAEELSTLTSGLGVNKDELTVAYDEGLVEQKAAEAKAAKEQLEQDKIAAEVENLKGKYEFEAAQKALDRALEQKKIGVQWYNATTSRMAEERQASGKDDEYQTYDSKNIPPDIQGEVLSDIKNVKRLKLTDLLAAYPEVDTKYLTKLYNDNQ